MTMSLPSTAPTRLQGLSPRTPTSTSKLVGSALAVFESNLRNNELYSRTASLRKTNTSPPRGTLAATATTARPLTQQSASIASSSNSSASSHEIKEPPKRALTPSATAPLTRRKTTAAMDNNPSTATTRPSATAAPPMAAKGATNQPDEPAPKLKKKKKVVTRVVKRVKPKRDGEVLTSQSEHAPTKTRRPKDLEPGPVKPTMKRGKSQPPRAESNVGPQRSERRKSMSKRPIVQPITLEEPASFDSKDRRSKSQPRTPQTELLVKSSRPAAASSESPRSQQLVRGANAATSSRAILQSQPSATVSPKGGMELRKAKSARLVASSGPLQETNPFLAQKREVPSRAATVEQRQVRPTTAAAAVSATAAAFQEQSKKLESDIAFIQAKLARLQQEKETTSNATNVSTAKDRQGRFERKPPPRTRSSSEPHKRPAGDATTATNDAMNERTGQRRVVGRVPRRMSNPDVPPPQSPTNIEPSQPVRRIGRVPRRQTVAFPGSINREDLVERDLAKNVAQDDSFPHVKSRMLQRQTVSERTLYPSSAPTHSLGKSKLSKTMLAGLSNVPLTDDETNSTSMNDHSASSDNSRLQRRRRLHVLESETSESYSSVDLYQSSVPSATRTHVDASTNADSDASEQVRSGPSTVSTSIQGYSYSTTERQTRRPFGRVPRPSMLAAVGGDATATIANEAPQSDTASGSPEAQDSAVSAGPATENDASILKPTAGERRSVHSGSMSDTKCDSTMAQTSAVPMGAAAVKFGSINLSTRPTAAKPAKRRVFPVNDSVTPVNPDGKRKVAGSIIAGRLAGLALDDSPCPTSNPLSLQERIRLFQTATGVKNELLHIPDKTRIGRPVMSFVQKRKKGAIKIQALVRGIIQRNAVRRSHAIVRLQAFARMVAPRQAFRLRLLHRKYVATLRRQHADLALVQERKSRAIESLKKQYPAAAPKALPPMERKEEEMLRDLFQQNSSLQQSNAKLQEMRIALQNMSQMNDMTQAAQMQSLRTLQDAVGLLTEKNDALTRQARKYEERLDARSDELNEMRARIVYESNVRKLMEKAVSALVDMIESRCDDEALVKRIVAISSDEDYQESEHDSFIVEEEELSMASDELKSPVAPKKVVSTDGFELSFRVMGLDDDDVSELCSSEHMLMEISEEGEYEVEYDEITVDDSQDLDDNDDTLASDDASSVWNGNHDIII